MSLENVDDGRTYGRTMDVGDYHPIKRWSGGAMVLGKLPVPGHPTTLIKVGQGPPALAAGADGGCFGILLSSILSFLFLPLFGRRPDID